MNIDIVKVRRYLTEIRKNSLELKKLISENQLHPDTLALKAVKYVLIELAEAVSNTLAHILAKDRGVAVSGYVDTVVKAFKHGIISETLFTRLKPFLDFRNSLIHRYWIIDDRRLIDNIVSGQDDFDLFVDEMETFLNGRSA